LVTARPILAKARIPSGMEGLDNVIEGGFQKDSLIILGGPPGTGKTEFATKFLCEGISTAGETTLYVSLSEDKEQLLADLRHRDPESAKLAMDKRFRFLDILPMKGDGMGFATQVILEEVTRFHVQRLVIDSYTAMALGFKDGQDGRSFLQAVLHKIVRLQGCTTLMTSEESGSGSDLEFLPEQYVADAVLWLEKTILDERLFRVIDIMKMRGTRLVERRLLYSLEGGLIIFAPSNRLPSIVPGNPVKTIQTPGKFSTGIPDLDALMGGGLKPGEGLLFSTDSSISNQERELFTGNAVSAFLSAGNAVTVMPPTGEGVFGLDHYVGNQRGREGWNDRLALFYPEGSIPKGQPLPKSVTGLSSRDSESSFAGFYKKQSAISDNGRLPTLTVSSIDQLFAMFGESMIAVMDRGVSGMRSVGGIAISTLRPGLPAPHLYEEVRALADFHFKLTRQEGVLVTYGIRPRTSAYVVEFDDTPTRPIPKFRLID
jgi:KaiC/GvpD/RAD55 family RecA-like ATPase